MIKHTPNTLFRLKTALGLALIMGFMLASPALTMAQDAPEPAAEETQTTAPAENSEQQTPDIPENQDPREGHKIVEPDQRMTTNTYKPDYCEFVASFPEEPLKGRRCESDDPTTCYDLVSFTKVFGLSSTVRVEVICNPSSPELHEQFTVEAMKETVRAMTQGSVIEAHQVQVRDEGTYRQAGLVGKGRAGMDETIYVSQLWSGPNSVMAVEAELVGEQLAEADQLFAGILKSIGYQGLTPKNGEQPAGTPEEAPENNGAENTPTEETTE